MKILIVNPNTTQAVTDRIAGVARAAASAGTTIECVTATFGATVITSRAEDALAGHAALDAAAKHFDGHDAVILGASWDTALAGLRELLPVPVTGFTESAMTIATLVGDRFGLVTVDDRAAESHRRIIESTGLAGRFTGTANVAMEYVSILSDPDTAVAQATEAALRLVAQRAEAIIPTGAVFAGLHTRIQANVPVPVLDPTTCAVQLAEALARMKIPKATAGSRSKPPARTTRDVSEALARLFGS